MPVATPSKNGILGNMFGGRSPLPFGTKQSRQVAVKPVDPDNVDSTLTPDEIEHEPYVATLEDEAKVKKCEQRFTDSSSNRRWHEGAWFESLAMYLGNQYSYWDMKQGVLRTRMDVRKPHKIYDKRNKIRPRVKKLERRILATQTDAEARPQTQSKQDIAASYEARDIIAHCDNVFERPYQTKRVLHYATTTTTCALHLYWDPEKEEAIPQFGPDGSIVGSVMAPVGGLCEDVVPMFDLYPDPRARFWDEMAWLIYAKTRTLEYVQQRYGERGKAVAGDAGEGASGYVESRLAAVVGEYVKGSEPGAAKTSVIVKEMWEPPSSVYPDGRLIVWANGVLLRDDPWPYKGPQMGDVNRFPFVPLSFEDAQSSLFGLNAVADSIEAQRSINEGASRRREHRNTAWGKILVPTGAQIPKDAFDSATPNERIPFTGEKPIHLPAPAYPAELSAFEEQDEADLMDMFGQHESVSGQNPQTDLSGVALQRLQEADDTQLGDCKENVSTFHKRRAEWEIALYGEFAIEPRMVWLSQSKPKPGDALRAMLQQQPSPAMPMGASATMGAGPDTPQPGVPPPPMPGAPGPTPQPPPAPGSDTQPSPLFEAKSFKALNKGGQARVIVTTGSGLMKGTAAWNEFCMKMYELGAFGPPNSPEATGILLDCLEFAGASAIVEAVRAAHDAAQAALAAQQPDPAALQQMQQEHAQQMLAMQAQMAETKAALDLHTKLLLQQAKTQGDIQVAQIQSSAEERARDHQTDAVIQEQSHQAATSVLVAEHAASLPKQPSVALTSPLDPAGRVSAEEQAGLKGDPNWQPPAPGGNAPGKKPSTPKP